MNEIAELTVHLYKSRNLIIHLKGKLKVGTKQPVTISDAIGSTRVFHTLHTRLNTFLDDNPQLSYYSGICRSNLRKLGQRFSKLNNTYTEDDENNLSDKQKQQLSELILEVEEAIMSMAGRLNTEAEIEGFDPELPIEARNFSDESKSSYLHFMVEDERKEIESNKPAFEASLDEVKPGQHDPANDLQDEDLGGLVLGSVGRKKKDTKGKATEDKREEDIPVVQVISPDIYI